MQQQLEAAGASPALRRAAEAFACDDTVLVARVEITGAPEALFQGATATLGARVFGSDGEELSGRGPHWSVTNEAVLTVDSQGRVEALAPGTSTVRAEVDAVAASVVLTVFGAVAQLDVEPGSMTLGVGEERPVRITARDRVGNALPAEPEIVITDPRVATAEDGVVRGIRAGETRLLVRAEGGLTRTVMVTVAGDDEAEEEERSARRRVTFGVGGGLNIPRSGGSHGYAVSSGFVALMQTGSSRGFRPVGLRGEAVQFTFNSPPSSRKRSREVFTARLNVLVYAPLSGGFVPYFIGGAGYAYISTDPVAPEFQTDNQDRFRWSNNSREFNAGFGTFWTLGGIQGFSEVRVNDLRVQPRAFARFRDPLRSTSLSAGVFF